MLLFDGMMSLLQQQSCPSGSLVWTQDRTRVSSRQCLHVTMGRVSHTPAACCCHVSLVCGRVSCSNVFEDVYQAVVYGIEEQLTGET